MELKHTAQRAGRLSSFLREEMALSAGLMNRLKWHEKILVNGVPRYTNFAVQSGDVITVLLDEEQVSYPPENGSLDIVYEDADILAVDKPAGMLIHPSRSRNSGTLANFVAGYYEKTGQKCAFHPVTRLDRDTYGITLLAKNAHAHALLQAVALQKTYHALVLGGPQGEEGVIDAPIARRPLPSLLRFVSPEGKPSVTQYKVLKRENGCAQLELHPITGRTHQLRVHCAHAGFPILGDPQYGSPESRACSEKNGLRHQRLLAYSLEFVHPVTGQPMCLTTNMSL